VGLAYEGRLSVLVPHLNIRDGLRFDHAESEFDGFLLIMRRAENNLDSLRGWVGAACRNDLLVPASANLRVQNAQPVTMDKVIAQPGPGCNLKCALGNGSERLIGANN